MKKVYGGTEYSVLFYGRADILLWWFMLLWHEYFEFPLQLYSDHASFTNLHEELLVPPELTNF